jgi:hypothetical protein
MASDGGRIGEKSAEETQKGAPQTADFVIPCDSCSATIRMRIARQSG